MNLDSGNPGEVPTISRHNLQTVKERYRSDLQIGIDQGSSANRKPRLNLEISDLVVRHGEIEEMDLNPVIVREKGLTAVDARVALST